MALSSDVGDRIAYFRRQLSALRNCVLQRVVPAFANVEAEADRVADEAWETAGASPATEDGDDDMSGAAEDATEAGVEHYMLMGNVLQTLLNALAVSAHHLFEQQLAVFLREELGTFEDRTKDVGDARREIGLALADLSVVVDEVPGWSESDDLRLIANTVKHANGGSATKLKERRPQLFTPPNIGDVVTREWTPSRLEFTAFGNDIYITEERLIGYIDALLAFWNALGPRLAGPERESVDLLADEDR